jgi:hypothetical protein
MKKIVEIQGENGVLEVVGNPQETILYLREKPIQYSWLAEIGSTWRYHIAQGLAQQAIPLHKGMEEQLRRGINNEGEFLGVSEYFNQFLKQGTYEYGYYELTEHLDYIPFPETEVYQSFDYYGGLINFASTQNFINRTLVKQYKEHIVKGSRPVVILLQIENSWIFHVLDGHHKFYAYQEAKIKPYAIIITKFDKEYRSVEEALALARQMGCTNLEYLTRLKEAKETPLDDGYYECNLEERFRLIRGHHV